MNNLESSNNDIIRFVVLRDERLSVVENVIENVIVTKNVILTKLEQVDELGYSIEIVFVAETEIAFVSLHVVEIEIAFETVHVVERVDEMGPKWVLSLRVVERVDEMQHE